MRRIGLIALATVIAVSCTETRPLDAPASIAGPTPVLAPSTLPTNVPGVLGMTLPIEAVDASTTSSAMTPFGFHGAGHAETGHTGWDFNYRSGAQVRAAAAGTIAAIFAEASTGRFTVQIEHLVDRHHYQTTYSSLATLSAGIETGKLVASGQALGVAAGISHFQLDDFEYYRDIPAPNAVSAEPFLTAAGKSQLDLVWSKAVYAEELIEPFITNPRAFAFPASRTWMRAGGLGPAGLRFTRQNLRDGYDYALLSESGTTIETGTVSLDVTAAPFATIDLVSATGTRRGIYDIVSNEMRIVLGEQGTPRPSSFASATVLRTVR